MQRSGGSIDVALGRIAVRSVMPPTHGRMPERGVSQGDPRCHAACVDGIYFTIERDHIHYIRQRRHVIVNLVRKRTTKGVACGIHKRLCRKPVRGMVAPTVGDLAIPCLLDHRVADGIPMRVGFGEHRCSHVGQAATVTKVSCIGDRAHNNQVTGDSDIIAERQRPGYDTRPVYQHRIRILRDTPY